jgi:hypothetical protein
MPTDIYLNPKFSKKYGWTSFESDPHLRDTKRAIHLRCLPCIKSLYQQLVEKKSFIDLGTAFDCWKVVVVMETTEECLNVLEIYRDRFLPERYIRGRYGGKDASSTQAIVVVAENELERENLMDEMKSCLSVIGLKRPLFYSKGCADPYEKILGPWKNWQRHTSIRHDENVEGVINGLDKLLRRI